MLLREVSEKKYKKTNKKPAIIKELNMEKMVIVTYLSGKVHSVKPCTVLCFTNKVNEVLLMKLDLIQQSVLC